MSKPWSIPREWSGETAFVVAGGPSVLGQDLRLLAGRRVVAVNSSYRAVPWADYLFTMDGRWLIHNRSDILRTYKGPGTGGPYRGRVVTDSNRLSMLHISWPEVLHLERGRAKGISTDPTMVCGYYTSLHGAINVAALAGATRIVLLGADGGPGPDGKLYHHEPHPWRIKLRDFWRLMATELKTTVEPLNAAGIEVINCSPESRLTCWPKVDKLESIL